MGERDFSGLPRLTPRETLAWASRVRSVSAYADPGPAVPAAPAAAAAPAAPVAEDVLAAFLAAAPVRRRWRQGKLKAPFRRHRILRFCVEHKMVSRQHVRCGHHRCCKCIKPQQLAARCITHNTMLHPNCTVNHDAYGCFIVFHRQGMLRHGSFGGEAVEGEEDDSD